MPNRQKDDLFQLIKSLGKGEKRNFKLYGQRNTANPELKVIQLFDALDRMDEYDEVVLLKKNPDISKMQLSNLKANLYRLILASLRLLKDEDNIEMQLHEQLDYARILYSKGLYLQSLKVLERLKLTARHYNQHLYHQLVVSLEKKIEAMYITRSMEARADHLAEESDMLGTLIGRVNAMSNLSLQLYSWYLKHGHARNKQDEESVEYYFKSHLPLEYQPGQFGKAPGFYEKLYLYQSYCWYSFIRQDFLTYYRYAQRWVALYHEHPQMKQVEKIQYIKGMHNLLGAHYDLRNSKKFFEVLNEFEEFWESPQVQGNDNYRIQTFLYLYTSKIHKHFLTGTFTEGLTLVQEIESRLQEYGLYLDRHRVLVFYYKLACLYFGSGDNERAIDYLNKIINWKVDLRTDLQCYARLLHLIAHFELGNHDLLAYLVKSVYRFMAKMENLSAVEEAMFTFLRESFHLSYRDVKPKLQALLDRIKKYEHNQVEARAFAYLDVISWLESKLQGVPVEKVIRDKYLLGKTRSLPKISAGSQS
ncbi:MAG: hypothetical protein V4717_10665 [Bacteroidota bacterium]